MGARRQPDDGTFKTAGGAEASSTSRTNRLSTDKRRRSPTAASASAAATRWFALKYLLGFKNVRNYDGSWTEWGNLGRASRSRSEGRARRTVKPDKLQQVIDMFADVRSGGSDGHAASLRGPVQGSAAGVATRPFDKSHQVPQCESDAYVWAQKQPDGTLKLYFAVENPSGISAKALAAILDKTLSGLPAAEIATVNCDIVEQIFRQNISMGKGMGLMSMVKAVQALARTAAGSA